MGNLAIRPPRYHQLPQPMPVLLHLEEGAQAFQVAARLCLQSHLACLLDRLRADNSTPVSTLSGTNFNVAN